MYKPGQKSKNPIPEYGKWIENRIPVRGAFQGIE